MSPDSPPTSPGEARRLLKAGVEQAIRALWGSEVEVSLTEPRNESFGDLSTQAALGLASTLRRPPREIAREIAEALEPPRDTFGRVSVDGPGFVNFSFSQSYLDRFSYRLGTQGIRPLLSLQGTGRRALVEFVSSNPTGPLSVGHCRQAVLGEAVAGLLEAAGWTVEREYYFNDAGRQTLLLGESLAARYAEQTGASLEIPEGGYQGEYLAAWARSLSAERGGGLSWPADSEVFVSYARDRAMEMIVSDLELLGFRFDRFFNESSLIAEAVPAALRALSAISEEGRSLVYEEPPGSGKMWLRLTALGRPEDRVLVRESGMYTYRAPDIAYHLDKFSRGYDLLVDIFGSDHIDTSRDVAAAVGALLGERELGKLRVIIHQFVTLLRGGRKVKMSTRAATFVTMRELLEEVGSPDVTRYLFLTRRAEAHMDFDLELARRQSDENPVYYVQYACARISGIIRTAASEGVALPSSFDDFEGQLVDPAERNLVRLLELIPCRVAAATESLEPHRLTEMLADVATAFHSFYTKLRVVDASAPRLSSARLLLCAACRNTMRDLLAVLGVEAPERM